MTSIITTIENDLKKVVSAIDTGADEICHEAKAILSSISASTWAQLIALLKESPVGTAVANEISAVQAAGGNIPAALPKIITGAQALITSLDKNGNILAEFESEVTSIATALVSDIESALKGNNIIGPLITLVSDII